MENRKFHSLDNIVGVEFGKCNANQAMFRAEDSTFASLDDEGSVQISLLERLIRTHPIWFLPGLQRSGAIHYLQSQDVGNFIVRDSTQPNTMAVSVKLDSKVEHYLLKTVDKQIALENSSHTFETVYELIHFYCSTSSEIPVCLTLPGAISDASSRQQLRSLALLGQEFWCISMREDKGVCTKRVATLAFVSAQESQSSSSNSVFESSLDIPASTKAKVPQPPPRWSKSALLSSTLQSPENSYTFTTTNDGVLDGQVDVFIGKKTTFDDRASDYEDIWSPMNAGASLTSSFKPKNNRLSIYETKSVYSEPIDTIRYKRFGTYRHSEPSIGWSNVVLDRSHLRKLQPNLKVSSSLDYVWREQSDVFQEKVENGSRNKRQVKFPVATPPNSPGQRHESYRFSRYDNLEMSTSDDIFPVDNPTISQPWDSSKWEHLLKYVSDTSAVQDMFGSASEKAHGSIIIQRIVKDLSQKNSGVFGPTLHSFVTCTKAAKCKDPNKIMKNIRQFINGMKNYLTGTSSSETDRLRQEIKKQTELLDEFEFLNIDMILEAVLLDLVLPPLYDYVLELLQESNTDLEIQAHEDSENLPLREVYEKFRETCSPLLKLHVWNDFVSLVQRSDPTYNSDTSVETLASALAKVCSKDIKCHVDFMLALLPQATLDTNDFMVTLLQSVLQRLQSNTTLTSVKVLIPNERNGTLVRKIIPVQNSTTCGDVLRMVSSKLGISNTSDYVLVRIRNGEERICPEQSKIELSGDDALAFKRINAKIGWPAKI